MSGAAAMSEGNSNEEMIKQRVEKMIEILEFGHNSKVNKKGGSKTTMVFHGASIATPENSYDEVFPSLFVGDRDLALDPDWLVKEAFTDILNCAEGTKFGQVNTYAKYYENVPVTYCGIRAVDFSGFNIMPFLDRGADFVNTALNNKGKVYVHCHQGISRSATFAIAYLIKYKGMSVEEALEQLVKNRKVYPNEGFLKILIKYETQCRQSQTV